MKVFLGPHKEERVEEIEIHDYDTWSMDDTLAMIIHPMLVQLKATTHGYPSGLTEERWNEILDEMIWAFGCKMNYDWQDQFYGDYTEPTGDEFLGSFEWIDREGMNKYQERMSNGFKLFGEYYENLWD